MEIVKVALENGSDGRALGDHVADLIVIFQKKFGRVFLIILFIEEIAHHIVCIYSTMRKDEGGQTAAV